MDDKLKKEYLHRIVKARLIEDQITLLEQFGEEYCKSKAVSGSLPLPYLCPACDSECKEHLEPVYKCTACSGIFSGNDL